MIKRIITFVLCLALCVSCIAVGVINQKADDTDIAAEADGEIEGISAAPEGATQVSGELYVKDGVYYLNDNVTITRENAANNLTYQALKDLLDVKAVEGVYSVPETAVIFDGNGNTITTEIPLFDVIGNVTIRNLTVVADNNAETAEAEPIELTNDDIFSISVINWKANGNIDAYRVGIISAIVKGDLTFTNVTVNGGLDYSGDDTIYGVVAMGGFVGSREDDNSITSTITLTDCTNNASLNLAPGANAASNVTENEVTRLVAGGFIGSVVREFGSVTFESCVNNGDVTVTTKHVSLPGAGGFLGKGYGHKALTVRRSVNTGDITVNQNFETAKKNLRAGGFAGRVTDAWFDDCVNFGDITANVVYVDSDFRIGGILGDITDGRGPDATAGTGDESYINRCINFGDVVTNSIRNQPCGGIVGYLNVSRGSCTNSIALGRVETMTTPTAEGTFASVGHVIGHPIAAVPATSNNNYYVYYSDVVNDGYVVPSFNGYGQAGNADSAIEISSLFTTTATSDNAKFTTSIDKELYDLMYSIISTIAADNDNISLDLEFGGIVTLKKYDEKIDGEFTHAIFDAYLEANKGSNTKLANINSLYMNATFRDGRVTQTLIDSDLSGDSYVANVTLKDATAATEYVARTFVKIGDFYLYSK